MLRQLYRSFSLGFHLMHTSFQMARGAWKISQLPQPIITIFGGSRIGEDSPFAQEAHDFAHKLVHNDISIITGGGPGIMQAATCGAEHDFKEHYNMQERTLGITVQGLLEQLKEKPNRCVTNIMVMDSFFARKYLMIYYSVGFVIFPGGFGTLDELFEVITLIQTQQIPPSPIILVNRAYWLPLTQWLTTAALQQRFINSADFTLIRIVDSPLEALPILIEHCKNYAS